MAINNDFRVKNGLYVGEDINALRGSVSALTYYGKLFDVGVAGAGGSGSTDVLSGQDTLTFEAVSGVNVTVSDGNLKFNLDVSSSFEINTNTLDLTDTGVSAGAYGSSTQIPVVTVDAQGRVTSLTSTAVQASTLSASDGSNNIEIDLGSETFSIVGTSLEVETAASGNQIQIGLPDDVTIGNDLTVTGNLTVNGTTTTLNTTVTATTSAVENNFVIESTDDGASAAPDLKLYRNSSSPSASDQVGDIIFTGKNSAAEDVNYGHIYGTIIDAVDGTEDGLVRLGAISGGTMDDTLSIRSGKVGIGTSNPNEKFTVSGALSASADSYINTLVIGNAGNANNVIVGKCGTIGANITSGSSNTLLGIGASQALTTGSNNVSIGNYVNHYNTTGSDNISLGANSNYSSGSKNIVLGNSTWQSTNATGSDNIVLGYANGASATSANTNVIIGYASGKCITTGYGNTFLGKYAGYKFTTGGGNIAMGIYAEPGGAGTQYAISIGRHTGNYNYDGSRTVSIGYCAGYFNAASQGSVNIGQSAGFASSGTYNVHLGPNAGRRNEGNDNIAIGHKAGCNASSCTITNSIVIGTNQRNIGSNTAIIGNSSMTTAVISATNVGIGKSNPSVPLDVSGAVKTDSTVTFSGLSTGTSNNVLILDGSNNVVYDEINSAVWDTSSTFLKGQGTASHVAFFTASDTLSSEATGELYWDSSNNRLGINTNTPNETVTVSGALSATSDSYINTLVVGNAGCSNSVIIGKSGSIGGNTGSDCNTFIGTNVFNSLSAGSGRHVGIGINIGQGSTGGDENIAIGHDVLCGNEQKGIFIGSNTWTSQSAAGGYNVVIGYNQNDSATTSYDNVLIGRDAGSELTTGSYNVMIGLRPGYHNAQEISNVVAIGNYANVGASSNQSISIGHRAASYTSDQTQSISMGYYGGSVSGASKYSINLGTYAGNQSSGDNNIHLGCNAGRRNQGADNIAIGRSASSNSSACTVTNSIVIGAAQSNIGSNTTIIGNSSMTTAVISAGKVGIGNTTPNEVLTVTGNISSTGTVYADAFESKSGNGSIDFNDNVDMSGTMVVSGAATFTNDVTLGDASGDTLTIKSATINPENIAAGTDDTVVIYNGSTLVTDEINSKVWDTAATFITGTGTDNRLANFNGTDALDASQLSDDGTTVTIGVSQTNPVVIEPTSTTTSVKYGNGTSGFHSICTTVGASTSAVVASFPHADYRSGKVVVQSSVNSAQYEAAEILVVHDGTTVCGTEYGNITTGSTFCVSYEARINGSNVELVATNACAASSDVVVAVTQLANT